MDTEQQELVKTMLWQNITMLFWKYPGTDSYEECWLNNKNVIPVDKNAIFTMLYIISILNPKAIREKYLDILFEKDSDSKVRKEFLNVVKNTNFSPMKVKQVPIIRILKTDFEYIYLLFQISQYLLYKSTPVYFAEYFFRKLIPNKHKSLEDKKGLVKSLKSKIGSTPGKLNKSLTKTKFSQSKTDLNKLKLERNKCLSAKSKIEQNKTEVMRPSTTLEKRKLELSKGSPIKSEVAKFKTTATKPSGQLNKSLIAKSENKRSKIEQNKTGVTQPSTTLEKRKLELSKDSSIKSEVAKFKTATTKPSGPLNKTLTTKSENKRSNVPAGLHRSFTNKTKDLQPKSISVKPSTDQIKIKDTRKVISKPIARKLEVKSAGKSSQVISNKTLVSEPFINKKLVIKSPIIVPKSNAFLSDSLQSNKDKQEVYDMMITKPCSGKHKVTIIKSRSVPSITTALKNEDSPTPKLKRTVSFAADIEYYRVNYNNVSKTSSNEVTFISDSPSTQINESFDTKVSSIDSLVETFETNFASVLNRAKSDPDEKKHFIQCLGLVNCIRDIKSISHSIICKKMKVCSKFNNINKLIEVLNPPVKEFATPEIDLEIVNNFCDSYKDISLEIANFKSAAACWKTYLNIQQPPKKKRTKTTNVECNLSNIRKMYQKYKKLADITVRDDNNDEDSYTELLEKTNLLKQNNLLNKETINAYENSLAEWEKKKSELEVIYADLKSKNKGKFNRLFKHPATDKILKTCGHNPTLPVAGNVNVGANEDKENIHKNIHINIPHK